MFELQDSGRGSLCVVQEQENDPTDPTHTRGEFGQMLVCDKAKDPATGLRIRLNIV